VDGKQGTCLPGGTQRREETGTTLDVQDRKFFNLATSFPDGVSKKLVHLPIPNHPTKRNIMMSARVQGTWGSCLLSQWRMRFIRVSNVAASNLNVGVVVVLKMITGRWNDAVDPIDRFHVRA
jgi:hypothetical protein